MHIFTFRWLALYAVVQGGHFDQANTIYFWPILSLSQEAKTGFDFPNGRKYHWILAVAFLFWTVGITW